MGVNDLLHRNDIVIKIALYYLYALGVFLILYVVFQYV